MGILDLCSELHEFQIVGVFRHVPPRVVHLDHLLWIDSCPLGQPIVAMLQPPSEQAGILEGSAEVVDLGGAVGGVAYTTTGSKFSSMQ